MTNHQRKGAISNAHAGREFEAIAREYFAKSENWPLVSSYEIRIGISSRYEEKIHRFDLGCAEPPVLIECKSHNWTETGNMPSAKITVWNEAMYYFSLAPAKFRKILFVLEAKNESQNKTLAEYYVQINGHLIPDDVSIIEFNPESQKARYIVTASEV